MLAQWEYDDWSYDTDDPSKIDIKRRGLKEHLKYNETFYTALINNYRDLGWRVTARDAYYTYRKARRQERWKGLKAEPTQKEHSFGSTFLTWCSKWSLRAKIILVIALEYFCLEITSGYCVKPAKLFRTFIIFWLAFSLYYVGFLRHRDKWILPWWQAWNPFRHKSLCFWWALLHSLDIILPGINLHSLAFLNKSPYIFKAESKWVVWSQGFQQIVGWYVLALFIALFGQVSIG